MVSKYSLVLSLLAFCGVARTEEYKWISPEYKEIFKHDLPIPPIAEPKATWTNATTGTPIDFYEIKIKGFKKHVYPGLAKVHMVGYDGIAPGPTFKVTRGHETVIRFINEFNRSSVVHLHGSYTRAPFDGWAEDTIELGQYKDYYYPNQQTARTIWYHDHANHITAINAYFGQAGFYIVDDPEENERVKLPCGKYDVPMILESKQFYSNGTLVSPGDVTGPLHGDVIHVNGQPWPNLDVEPRKYRFRILDGSITRIFQLSFVVAGETTEIPFKIVAGDSGLLSHPITATNIYMSMAERYEIVVDFAGFEGKKIVMKNARGVVGELDYAATDRVMQFTVGDEVTDYSNNEEPPAELCTLNLPAGETDAERKFVFGRTNNQWTINGKVFSDANNRILAKPKPGTIETWDLVNNSTAPHPVHIHLIDMQIVSRTGPGRGFIEPYEAAGLKDVILISPNETVQIKAVYGPWNGGLYMFHCHNLQHEDNEMMAAFNLTKLTDLGYPETSNCDDPMDERFRAKLYPGTTNLTQIVDEVLPRFSGLDSYSIKEGLVEAMGNYHKKYKNLPMVSASSSAVSTMSEPTTTTTTMTTTTVTATALSDAKKMRRRRRSVWKRESRM